MNRMLICTLLVLSISSVVHADDEQTACIRSAVDAHLDAKIKLLETAGPLMSPEAQIQRRRLDEKYCVAFSECGLKGETSDARALMASTIFSSCLKKEEKE